MDRRPLTHRAAPAYPDRCSSGWVLRAVALGTALGGTALVGCETPPEPSPHTQGVNALPGEMPVVEGDIQAVEIEVEPVPQPDPSGQPVIPEAEAARAEQLREIEAQIRDHLVPDEKPAVVLGDMPVPRIEPIPEDNTPRMPGVPPSPSLDDEVEPEPMPGEPVAPAEPAPVAPAGDG